jgi:hypothetical protein
MVIETWSVKYDKAAECLIKDRDALLAFYDFPAVNRCRSYCSSASSKRDTNTSHSIALRRIRCPPEQAANMADNSRATKGGQLMRYRQMP